MFIEIIKSKFKEKFPNVNLSQARVTALAEKLNGLIKEEADIDTQLTLIDTVTPFAEIARLDDVERNAKSRKEEPKTATTEPAKSDEMPEWAKQLVEQNKTLAEKIAQNEQQSTQEKRLSELKKRIKDLPQEIQDKKIKHFGLMNFENDELLNEFLADTEAEVSTFVQSSKDKAASTYTPASSSKAASVSKADQEIIDKAVDSMNF